MSVPKLSSAVLNNPLVTHQSMSHFQGLDEPKLVSHVPAAISLLVEEAVLETETETGDGL